MTACLFLLPFWHKCGSSLNSLQGSYWFGSSRDYQELYHSLSLICYRIKIRETHYPHRQIKVLFKRAIIEIDLQLSKAWDSTSSAKVNALSCYGFCFCLCSYNFSLVAFVLSTDNGNKSTQQKKHNKTHKKSPIKY